MASEKDASVKYLKYVLILLVIILVVGVLTLINTGGLKAPSGKGYAWSDELQDYVWIDDTSEPVSTPTESVAGSNETFSPEPVATEKGCNSRISTATCAGDAGCCWDSTGCRKKEKTERLVCKPVSGTTPSPDPCTSITDSSKCPSLKSDAPICMWACG